MEVIRYIMTEEDHDSVGSYVNYRWQGGARQGVEASIRLELVN